MSPTQRAIKDLKELGFTAQVVERWNSYARVHQDLFGCIDIIACKQGVGILGIQVTSGTNHAARRSKAEDEPRIKEWMLSGGRMEIWSYSKRGGRGERKRWELRREELFL